MHYGFPSSAKFKHGFHIFEKNTYFKGFPGGSVVKNLPANVGDTDLIPRWGRSPGEGNGNSPQYSFWKNPMDRGTWQVTVQGVTKESHTT